MSGMIERITAALWDAGLREDHDVRTAFAFAALEAMREPTNEMIKAALECDGPPGITWEAMLDAALSDGERPQ